VITSRDLGWAAGFLEGEGTFRLRANLRRSGGTTEINATQVHREPLDRLRLLFGGAIYLRHRHPHPKSFSSRPIYNWYLSGVAARGLMMTLYPMMSSARKAQIRTALDAWRSRPGTGIRNRAKTTCPRGHPYDVTVHLRGGKQVRRCRQCFNASHKAWRDRQAAE